MALKKYMQAPLFALADLCMSTQCDGLVIHQDITITSSDFRKKKKEYLSYTFGHMYIFKPRENEALPHIAMGYCENCLKKKAKEEEQKIRASHVD